MKPFKAFGQFLKRISTKQTVIIAVIALTLYMHLMQGVTAAVASGSSYPFVLSIQIWVIVTVSGTVVLFLMLFILFIVQAAFADAFKKAAQRKEARKKRP